MKRNMASVGVAIASALVGSAPAGETPVDCMYENTGPWSIGRASQYDVDPSDNFLFAGEVADDFRLFGDSGYPCAIDRITFQTYFFNYPVGVEPDPSTCWTGVNVTVYEDITRNRPDEGDPNCLIPVGPAAYPDEAVLPALEHVACFPGAVVCDMELPMSAVSSAVEFAPDQWEIELSGLAGLCTLERDHLYWIAIAPVMDFGSCGQTSVLATPHARGLPMMQFFPVLDVHAWTPMDGDAIVVVEATRAPPACPADTNDDMTVDVDDLNNVILDWGTDGSAHGGDVTDATGTGPPDGIVDVNDLTAVIVAWGPCRAPARGR